MNGNSTMPTIGFGEDTDYDTMLSVIHGWVVSLTLEDGCEVTGMFTSTISSNDTAEFEIWDDGKTGFPMRIALDSITKVVVV